MALPKSTFDQEIIPDDWLNEIAAVLTSQQTVSIAGAAGDQTLSSTEYRCRALILSGAITGNRNAIVPADAGRAWLVYNNTSGAFTATVKTSGGAGVTVPQGWVMLVRCDGTDVLLAAPGVPATPATMTQTYATADATHAAMTSADLTGIATSTTGTALAAPSAGYVQAEQQQNFRRIQDQFNASRADILDLKQFVNSVVDELQKAKLLG